MKPFPWLSISQLPRSVVFSTVSSIKRLRKCVILHITTLHFTVSFQAMGLPGFFGMYFRSFMLKIKVSQFKIQVTIFFQSSYNLFNSKREHEHSCLKRLNLSHLPGTVSKLCSKGNSDYYDQIRSNLLKHWKSHRKYCL